MYADGLQIRILNKENNINFGSVYENAVAQELCAHGFEVYYFNNKKQGNVDFVIEFEGEALPLEVKSGKDYTKQPCINSCVGKSKLIIFRMPLYFVMKYRSERSDFLLVRFIWQDFW